LNRTYIIVIINIMTFFRLREVVVTAASVVALWPSGATATGEIDASRRTALVRAVERVQPAVASVHVTHRERVVYRYHDPFREFLMPFSPYFLRERDRTSGGSGIIVGEGFVLTNDHVIGDRRGLSRIAISLPSGRTVTARYIAGDWASDLAVLRVQETDLPVAPLGDSDDILVGEWAIAIGNPFDLGPTVSIGVVSAVNRDFQQPKGNYYYRDMIQTDAAINPGNSGGALINAAGDVIGINSFIYTGSEYNIGSIGIGFAIPINAARSFLEEVRLHGQARRPWSGILDLQDLTQRLVEYLDLTTTDGALVAKIAVESPAYVAGLEHGDVIVAINGEKIRSAEEAGGVLRSLRVDEECTLEVVRGGEVRDLRMRIGEQPRSRARYY
jgi:serine protease Do